MKLIICLAAWLFSMLFLAPGAWAQETKDPATWIYEAKSIGNEKFALTFHVRLDTGWHLFSQQPGDEMVIPTSFTFTPSKHYQRQDKVRESGTLKVEKLEISDQPLRYYVSFADFVQIIKRTGALREITGELTYQLCNDRLCLPPRTVPFQFKLP